MKRAATGIVSLLILAALSLRPVAAAEPLADAEAVYETVPRIELFDAVIEAVNRATVSAQVSGTVTELNFDVDDYVEKGAVILRFRDTQQRAAVNAAQARFEEARAEYRRMEEIYGKGLVAKSDFDKAEAALESAKAALQQARERLQHTVVRAPFSGIVVERHIEPGETANPGQPLMTGLSLEHLRAVAHVPQRDIGAVRQHAKARVVLDRNGDSLQGQELTISPYADPKSHTFKVRVVMPPGQHGVYPGMFTKVAFVTGEERRLVIPAQAVVRRSEVTAVYVLDGDGIRFRQIRVGRELEDQRVEVLAGLEAGERVALEPVRAGIRLKERRSGEGQ